MENSTPECGYFPGGLHDQANAFHLAADRIAERFIGGQPILVGHHSERRARRDQDRMHKAMDTAVAAAKAVDYWNYRSAGVEHHANRKSDPGVRARRIKKLLAELRDWQRDINHAFICLELWETVQGETNPNQFKQAVEHYAGTRLKTGGATPWLKGKSYWQQLRDGTITPDEVVENCLSFYERQARSPYKARWISHLLNRLAWERSELGEVERFTGTITASTLQAFAREHGAHQPKAKKDGDKWRLTSSVPLPLHIGDGKELLLKACDWCNLMQASGYEVPAPKPKHPPILNFEAAYLKGHRCGDIETFRQIKLTKAEYSAIYSNYRGIKLSACGQFRFKVCKNPEQTGWDAEWCAVLLTDSKQHEAM